MTTKPSKVAGLENLVGRVTTSNHTIVLAYLRKGEVWVLMEDGSGGLKEIRAVDAFLKKVKVKI